MKTPWIERTRQHLVRRTNVMALHRLVLPLAGSLLFTTSIMAQEEAVAPPPAAQESSSSALGLLRQLDRGFVEVYNKVAPAVVVIENNRKPNAARQEDGEMFDFFFRSPDDENHRRFPMPDREDRSEGSGFILQEDGFILTNNHVIDGAEKIMVKLKDGRRFQGKIVGTDDRTDVAVIKIDAKGLPTLAFGDSDAVQVGQIVGAIGIPFALDYSFSVGVISGKGRANISTSPTYQDYIQTDAFINPGNSGGPLFDVEGQVIGMNTLINGIGRGLAFAIPSNMLRDISAELIANGKVRRPWLGIRIETLEPESGLREQINVEKGVVVNTIEPDTPAYKSDLRPLDVITAVDNAPVATAQDLQKQILKKKVGQKVDLTVWRAGKSLTVPVVTGELPASSGIAAASSGETPEKGETFTDSKFGFAIVAADKANAEKFGTREGGGVIISHVTPGSPAEVAGIQVGDFITEIASRPVKDFASAVATLTDKEQEKKKILLFFVERKGQKTYSVLKLEES